MLKAAAKSKAVSAVGGNALGGICGLFALGGYGNCADAARCPGKAYPEAKIAVFAEAFGGVEAYLAKAVLRGDGKAVLGSLEIMLRGETCAAKEVSVGLGVIVVGGYRMDDDIVQRGVLRIRRKGDAR